MYEELVQFNEPQVVRNMGDLASGRVLPLGDTPARWILTVAHRYIVSVQFLYHRYTWVGCPPSESVFTPT